MCVYRRVFPRVGVCGNLGQLQSYSFIQLADMCWAPTLGLALL